MEHSDIGLIGLAVMGENLALNLEGKGYQVSVWNRNPNKTRDFLNEKGLNKNFKSYDNLEDFVVSIKRPRKILLMIQAGRPVDEVLHKLLPHLESGDIILDGGNSNYLDTNRRIESLQRKGIHLMGTGISGGEVGALTGPSIMPGGSKEAWLNTKSILQKISAHLEDGTPCCDWVGEAGAGHFVKMIHNGIEYGDMQLIGEVYFILKHLLKMNNSEMSDLFQEWNKGELNSYLIEITSNILKEQEADGSYLIDHILDKAGQKGTGKWAVSTALEIGSPLTLISESVFARGLSALKAERQKASKTLKGPEIKFDGNLSEFLIQLKNALYAAKIISYTQGFSLMRSAAIEYNWSLNYGGIALMWRGGCIIRSVFLNNINQAFKKNPNLDNLLLDPFFEETIAASQQGWRQVVATALINGIPVPAMASALNYFDGYRTENLPANLLQAQRDYFGAHRFERTDKIAGETFHHEWNQ